MTWLDTEQPLPLVAWRQVARLLSRARHRFAVTATVALVLAATFLGVLSRRPKLYDAEVGLLITEGVLTSDGLPRPRGELRALIGNAIFITSRLEALIDKYDLVRRFGVADKPAALALFRSRIEIGVWQDYFIGFRQRSDPPRSARVSIGFSAPDPDLALEVARDLGALVSEAQSANEVAVASARVEALRVLAARAAKKAADVNELSWRETEDASLEPDPRWDVRRRDLSKSTREAEDESKAAAMDLFNAELQVHEAKRSGRLIQVVDPGLPLWEAASVPQRIARLALVSLSLGLLLSVLLVSTLDPAVRDEQDLQRIGLLPLGVVPVRPQHSPPTDAQV